MWVYQMRGNQLKNEVYSFPLPVEQTSCLSVFFAGGSGQKNVTNVQMEVSENVPLVTQFLSLLLFQSFFQTLLYGQNSQNASCSCLLRANALNLIVNLKSGRMGPGNFRVRKNITFPRLPTGAGADEFPRLLQAFVPGMRDAVIFPAQDISPILAGVYERESGLTEPFHLTWLFKRDIFL